MKNIFSLLILIFTSPIFAQQSFPIKIQDFSDRYEAIIDVNEDGGEIQGVYDAYFAEYVIFINDKKTQKNIITSYAHDFPNYLLNNENELLSNHYEFPYGSQSVLIYEDFNFDGIKDFALMTGYFSCYGGPAFVLENGVVDYFYPQPYFDELEKTFVYDALFYNSELKTLEFQDQNKSYKIYESENSVSLSIVSKDDREIEFEGDFSSLIGSLKDLTNIYSEDSNLIILANKVETNE